jgi:polysaccharide export outer membrane protein
MKIRFFVFFLALFALPMSSLASDYVIGEGDVLDVFVWGVKELNVSARVRPDGKITIPGLGDVKADGLTPLTLQKTLSDKLRALVKNPNVTVTVKEITNSKVYIFGGGVKSGVVDLTRRTTLLQLLCMIGDFQSADLRRAYVLRNGQKIKEDFLRLFKDGDTSQDILIAIGDSIYIPVLPQTDKNIYVLGAVNTPKTIEYREGLTVMEAVMEAGGFNKFAKQNDTTIMRRENGKEVVIPVRAKALLKDGDLSQNIPLKASDYVIVKEGMF